MRSALARVYLLPYTQEPLEATGHHGPARYFCVCWQDVTHGTMTLTFNFGCRALPCSAVQKGTWLVDPCATWYCTLDQCGRLLPGTSGILCSMLASLPVAHVRLTLYI